MRILLLAAVALSLLACALTSPAQIWGGDSSDSANSSEGITQTSGSLTVKLLEPQDGATVSTNVVTVKGEAPPETVVTVNDDILVVEASGKFESDVALEEGPNVIEIVASDLEGNQVAFIVTVTYEP
jgi:uncharacterized protein YfaP (DUF2135 family)